MREVYRPTNFFPSHTVWVLASHQRLVFKSATIWKLVYIFKNQSCDENFSLIHFNIIFVCLGFLIAVANGMGREKAFCSSRFLTESVENSTTFCRAQGILIHYFTGALALWFLVYSINLVQVKEKETSHDLTKPGYVALYLYQSLLWTKGKHGMHVHYFIYLPLATCSVCTWLKL